MRKAYVILFWCLVALTGLNFEKSWASTPGEYVREGYLSFVSRSWNEAIAWYTKAIELDPRQADAYFQRGIAREMANNIDDAIKDYEKTLELIPNHYLAMEYLAKLYEAKAEYGKAVEWYARGLPLVSDPKWKSIIKAWISEAQRKMREEPDGPAVDQGHRAGRQGLSSGVRRRP